MRDLLRDNSPALFVHKDSAHFRRWLKKGCTQALAGLPKVRDARGYAFLLKGYSTGFRDSHVQVWQTDESGIDTRRPISWPGFQIGLRQNSYVVVYRSSASADVPPMGAELVDCDGRSAAQLAQDRDRYDGDLSLDSGRFFAARYLMFDRGNPFVALPALCTFKDKDGTRPWRLTWRSPSGIEVKAALAAAAGQLDRRLGLTDDGGRAWWITVPSLDEGQGWADFYKKVESSREAIRAAGLVVIDVRGNGGGDSAYGDKLARLLWGDALVDARQPDLGPTVWRVSKVNRDYLAGLIAKLSADKDYPPADKAEMAEMLRDFDQALAAGRPTFRRDDAVQARPRAQPANPIKGRVVLLTDQSCNSACLDLMDLFTAMPNTVQAGTTTNADTIFMELTVIPALPSGLSSFAFSHKAWVKRPRPSNRPYVPAADLTWLGDPADDAGERAWLLQAVLKKPQ